MGDADPVLDGESIRPLVLLDLKRTDSIDKDAKDGECQQDGSDDPNSCSEAVCFHPPVDFTI